MTCTYNPGTLEGQFRHAIDSTPVSGNTPSVDG